MKLICIVTYILALLIPSLAFSQDFTATTVGDYGNISVMAVTGNYDAENPDGSVNDIPRQEIAKEFFRTHKDEYDFLAVFSNFDFQMPAEESIALYYGVKNDTQGTGQELFDNTALFGSEGKLQGIIDMGNISIKVTNALDPQFENTLYILSHELQHRWAAHVRFQQADGTISTDLLGMNSDHWNFLLDTDGSVLYGNDWQDNGDGTFTSVSTQRL